MTEPMFHAEFLDEPKLPHYWIENQVFGIPDKSFPGQREPAIRMDVLIDGPTMLVGVQVLTARDIGVLCAELQKALRLAERLWVELPAFPSPDESSESP